MSKLTLTRRTALGGLAAGGALSMFPTPFVRGLSAQAASEIVVGNGSPLTGVFAFAGVEGTAGAMACAQYLNEKGGIAGRKIRLVVEDTGYKVPESVAVFNRITSQNQLNLYFGDSTGFQKTINEELNRRGTIMLAGASFSSEISDAKAFPLQYMPGPDYSQQAEMLLQHVAEQKKGARLAIVHSDTEFGRDPIAKAEAKAKALGLEIVEKVVTPPGSFDVSAEVLKLRRARPEFTLFHGYVLAPIPEFMKQLRQAKVETQFLGTFYSSDLSTLTQAGEVADGYLGVSAYNYINAPESKGEAMDFIKRINDGKYRTLFYMQPWTNLVLGAEAMRRVLEAGQEVNGKTLKAALNSIRDFDMGGIIGAPVSIPGNTIPYGRVFRLNFAQKRMEPVSEWIKVA